MSQATDHDERLDRLHADDLIEFAMANAEIDAWRVERGQVQCPDCKAWDAHREFCGQAGS